MAQQEGGAPKLRFRNYQPKHDDLSTYTAQSREAPSREVQKKITQQDQHRVQQQHQQEHLKASGNQKAAAANADFFQGQAQYQGDALEGAGGDKVSLLWSLLLVPPSGTEGNDLCTGG
eukprot:gb/GECG01009639.1/.p1 GENE.gb/GECG01009639.1/~~gb/GECG01009639.1/.p1  ORF type:complete len:118 (+),score=22.38 gb/GECG01009639.1/:1-354(+)